MISIVNKYDIIKIMNKFSRHEMIMIRNFEIRDFSMGIAYLQNDKVLHTQNRDKI